MTVPVERDPTKSWIEDTQYFKDQCNIGKSFEKLVAEKLIAAGISDVVHEDSGFRKDITEIHKYTKTSGDLKIKGWPFEVKSRTEVFNTTDDWKYWPMFVDTVSSFDRKTVQPRGYIFISQATGALMGVGVKSKEHWTITKKWDNKRKISEKFYCVDKTYVVNEQDLIKQLKDLPIFTEENKQV